MRRQNYFLLLFFLLASCSKAQAAPKEITDFLDGCFLEKATQEVLSADVFYESILTSHTQKEETGRTLVQVKVDRRDYSDYYAYVQTTFSGSNILLDTESNLYVADIVEKTTLDSEDNLYHEITIKHGYKTEDLSGELSIYQKEIKYQESQIKEKSLELFYRSSNQGVHSGGLYYADFFKYRIRYAQFMSLDEDSLTFEVKNQNTESGEEKGYTSESLSINSFGMLEKLNQQVVNLTSDKESSASLTATYNQKIERI